MQQLTIIFLVFCLTGCAFMHFEQTEVGSLSGKLKVQWLEPDKFLFLPDVNDPLTFKRYNGTMITPGAMYTDGGSIPRILWAIKSYSPWGYAPAFIVHDWLFEMKHCKLPGHENYDVAEAAQVMSEVIKTLMEKTPEIDENKLVMYSMHKAVTSRIAEQSWDDGACKQVVVMALTGDGNLPLKVLMEYTIEFP